MKSFQEDILQFLKEKELTNSKKIEIRSQKQINSKMRAMLIDWLIDITVKFKSQAKTVYMTVDLIDRFISKEQVKRSDF